MTRRYLLGIAILFGTVSVSEANYIIIRIVMNQPNSGGGNTPDPSGSGGGNIGLPPVGGNLGTPPPLGIGGGGALGTPPPLGIGGGPPMGIMGGGSRPPMGFMGGSRPPMGIMGGPPLGIMGGGSRPPMGFMGGPPMGAIGSPPPLGIGGIGGNFGNLGGSGGTTPSKPTISTGDYVMVAVEYKAKDLHASNVIDRKINDLVIKHKWGGSTILFQDQKEIYMQNYKLATPAEQLQNRLLKVKQTSEELYNLAVWCLSVGLVDDCQKQMDKVVAIVDGGKEKETSDKVKAAAAVYKKLAVDFARGVLPMDTAKGWKSRLNGYEIKQNEFYAAVYATDSNANEMVERRLKLLTFTFKNFYLWHALKGKELPMPREKLTALLIDGEQTFKQFRNSLDAGELHSDGFFARRDNLCVFVNQRLDIAGRNFDAKFANAIRGYVAADLLKGHFPNDAKDPAKRREAARAAVYVLVNQALEEEAEIASTTHEGTRQLFAATGLLPRHVEIPEFLQFGLASIFEMPKGPFPGTFSNVKVALWPGVGDPSWAYMGYFKELDRKGELPREVESLVETITDDFFILAREGFKSKSERDSGKATTAETEKFNPAKEALLVRARTLSWAIAYYIANEKLDDLHKYFKELGSMPREMELDETTKLTAFARSFGLTKPSLTFDMVDGGKLNGFAIDWFKHMRKLHAPTVTLKLDDIKDDEPIGGSGFPGSGPGGLPGPGPGGLPGPGPGGLPGPGPGGLPGPGGGLPGPPKN